MVTQIRLQPVVVQNVTTYGTVITVPNRELKLKPGMTANVKIEIAKRTNALRIPNAALRFRPTNEVFAALKQTPLPEDPTAAAGAGRGGRGARRGSRRRSSRGHAAGCTRIRRRSRTPGCLGRAPAAHRERARPRRPRPRATRRGRGAGRRCRRTDR